MQALYKFTIGETTLQLQGIYGDFDTETVVNGARYGIKSNKIVGTNIEINYQNLSLRYGLSYLNLDISHPPELKQIQETMRSIGSEAPIFYDIADSFTLEDETFIYHSVSLNYDDGDWLILGEAGLTKIEAMFADEIRSGYLSLGYQFEKITPYVVYAYMESKKAQAIIDLIDKSREVEISDPDKARDAAVVRFAGNYAAESVAQKQKSFTLGVRIDISHNIDIKCEVQNFFLLEDTAGTFFKPIFYQAEEASLYSIAIDFVF